MVSQIKGKELITIWYDDEIHGRIDSTGKYATTKGIEKLLISLLDKKDIEHRVGIKDFVVEFDDMVIKIEGYKKFIKNDVFLQFYRNKIINIDSIIKNDVQELEVKRVQSLKKRKKKNLVPNNYLEPISTALEKRNKDIKKIQQKELTLEDLRIQNTDIKVNRNKKRSTAVRVTAFIGAALIAGGIVVSGKKELDLNYEKPNKNDYVVTDVGENLNEKINFQPEIDIATVFPETIEEDMQLSYEDNSDCDKVLKTKNNYYSIIQDCARKCGLDPRLVLGIATHESGDHEYGLNYGNKGGLMQIEMSFWDGKEIEYYDFDDNESYIIKIDKEVIKEVENNILIGCAILQNELRMFNDNILLATLSYNQGYTNTSKILNKTSLETGIPKMDIINNQSCLAWLDYTNTSELGDPDYVSNVLQYTGFGYDLFELVCKKENGDFAIVTTNPIIYETRKTI